MRIPRATYRIQFNPSFGFLAAKELVPYLAELGISDLYASPIFKARKGSSHGYDVVDQNQINPELGSESDLEELAITLAKHEIGWLQDIIPNHMSYSHENTMLTDIFENGQASDYYTFFDVEWEHPYEGIRGRVLAPFLGNFFGEALENGQIKLSYDDSGLWVTYFNIRFPLKIESYLNIFTHDLGRLKNSLGSDHSDFTKLLGIVYLLKNLPSQEENRERYAQITFAKRMFWQLYSTSEHIKRFIDTNILIFNGDPESPPSFNLLDKLLSEQHFRLSFWKVATEEINYRRFFNINDLTLRAAPDRLQHLVKLHALHFGREPGPHLEAHIDQAHGNVDIHLGLAGVQVGDAHPKPAWLSRRPDHDARFFLLRTLHGGQQLGPLRRRDLAFLDHLQDLHPLRCGHCTSSFPRLRSIDSTIRMGVPFDTPRRAYSGQALSLPGSHRRQHARLGRFRLADKGPAEQARDNCKASSDNVHPS